MFDLIKRYVAEKYMQFKDGQVWFGKERLIFVFSAYFTNEYLVGKELGPKYPMLMFIAGKKEGYTWVQQHGMPFMKSVTAVVRLGIEILNTFGYGTYRTVKVDDKNGFMVMTGRSTMADDIRLVRPSAEPVDFMLGGIFAGALQYFAKTPLYAVETSCIAQTGVQECLWVIGSVEAIMAYVHQFSPDKEEWAAYVLGQIREVEKELETKGSKQPWSI